VRGLTSLKNPLIFSQVAAVEPFVEINRVSTIGFLPIPRPENLRATVRKHLIIGMTALCAVTLNDCSGGGSSGGMSIPKVAGAAPIASGNAATRGSAAVSISIAIPQTTSSGFHRLYVSRGTKSVSLVVNPVGTSGASPSVTNCTSVCSLDINAPIGEDTFLLTMFDGPSGTGNRLSTGQVTQTIVMNQPNTVRLVLGGVIASLAVTLGSKSFSGGLSGSTAVMVAAKDAVGATIIGSDNFETPITLTTSNSGGSFSLSTQELATPSSDATLAYTGSGSTGTDVIAKVGGSQIIGSTSAMVHTGPTGPLETPAMADSIADAVGADTHFNYHGTPYTDVPAIKDMLISSGFRHIRDGGPAQSSSYTALMNDLYFNHGIDQIGGIDPQTTDADTIAWIHATPGIKAFEVCNECDGGGGDWVSVLKNKQSQVRNLMQANPAVFGNVKLLSPSLLSGENAQKLGSLSSMLDIASLHESVCGGNPGDTVGTGGNFSWAGGFPYQTMDFSLAWQKTVSGSKPVWVTEWGYNDSPPPHDCAIPDSYIAAYEPRSVFEWALRGMSRMYVYQFADQPNDPQFGNQGLVFANGTPKPQYFALKNLVRLFNDPGPSFSPAPVPVVIDARSMVHHYLTRKRDGTVMLAVWREALDYHFQRYAPANLPAEPASVHIGGNYSSAKVHVFDMNGNVRDSALGASGNVTLSLDAGVQVIELK